jgi:hypothetical protein
MKTATTLMTHYPVVEFAYIIELRRNRKREITGWRGSVKLGDAEIFHVNQDESRYDGETERSRLYRLEELFAIRLSEILEEK